MAWNAYGPLSEFTKNEYRQIQALGTLVLPVFAWMWELRGSGWLEKIFEKKIRGENLDNAEKEVLEEIMRIYVPEEVEEYVKREESRIGESWKRVEQTLEEIAKKIYGEHVLTKEIYVYLCAKPDRIAAEGTAIRDDTVALFIGLDERSVDVAPRTLAHEIIHIFNRRSGFDKITKKIKEKTGLPAEEAFTTTITNLVLWKAGITETMFDKYYDENWEELRKMEDKMREIVREWWLNGGDLRKMIEGRLGR